MNVKALIEDQEHLLEKARTELADFDSQVPMVNYEAQRIQIYAADDSPARDAELRHLDAENSELLKRRNDLLALRARAEIVLEELRQIYREEISEP